MATADQRQLHRAALKIASGYADRINETDLGRPTPCVGWNLGRLLSHMVGQHLGFAAAIRDGDAPKSAYLPVRFSRQSWRDSADELIAAFAGADLRGAVLQVELHRKRQLPVTVVIGAQLLDTVVHTWDIARSLGEDFTPSKKLVRPVLRMAEQIPDTGNRDAPGAAFEHALLAADTPWHQTLALLGRNPLLTASPR
ncbi:MAG: TIGR03086 family metal-binding protein [Actinomycetota bacterium]|nr:TIGR03086 family metal-binding protein [Actinomycetota bacterium]